MKRKIEMLEEKVAFPKYSSGLPKITDVEEDTGDCDPQKPYFQFY